MRSLMFTAITEGIKVSVSAQYQPEYSSAQRQHFVFTYRVRIENNSEHTMQLLRRHWYIHDAMGDQQEVEGEGVIGQQPVIEPGQSHQYVSGCNLKTPLGKMHGFYLMERLYDGTLMPVAIPEFTLAAPFLNN